MPKPLDPLLCRRLNSRTGHCCWHCSHSHLHHWLLRLRECQLCAESPLHRRLLLRLRAQRCIDCPATRASTALRFVRRFAHAYAYGYSELLLLWICAQLATVVGGLQRVPCC